MKKIITCAFILFIAFTSKVKASHIIGADLTYKHLTGNDYIMTLVIFRDCFGAPLSFFPVTVQATSSCGTVNHFLPFYDSVSVSPLCTGQTSACYGGAYPGVEVYTYSDTVVISPCSDWTFTYSLCCRNTAAINVTNPGSNSFYISSTLNNATAPNSSPIFTQQPTVFYCNNSTYCVNNTAYDTDGDSLVYSLIAPQGNSGTPISFNAGYSATNPFGNSAPFNSANGNICVTSTPIGAFLFAVKVEEYRSGVLVGTVTRDQQISSVACSYIQNIDIGGMVTDSMANPVGNTTVNIYQYDISAINMNLVGTTTTNGGGAYAFTNLPDVQYMVKAIADTNTTPGYVPTYHESTWYWNLGRVIYSACDTVLVADIQLTPVGNPIGTGIISGYMNGLGIIRGVLEDVHVFVINRANGKMVASGVTDVNGYYVIDNLPNGNYELRADIQGLIHTSTHFVTISGGNNVNNRSFVATPNGIYAVVTTNGENELEKPSVFMFPNPASTSLQIRFSDNEIRDFVITDISGRKIMNGKIESNTLDVSSLLAGTYLIYFKGIGTRRIVIAK